MYFWRNIIRDGKRCPRSWYHVQQQRGDLQTAGLPSGVSTNIPQIKNIRFEVTNYTINSVKEIVYTIWIREFVLTWFFALFFHEDMMPLFNSLQYVTTKEDIVFKVGIGTLITIYSINLILPILTKNYSCKP